MHYETMSYFLLSFFMFLELVPLAAKWSLGKTEYHYYIDARNNFNNQKIISLSNLFLQAMQNDPAVVLDMPEEITDILAAHMEDEAGGRNFSDNVDLRGILATLGERGRSRTAGANPNANTSTAAGPANPGVPGPAGPGTGANAGNVTGVVDATVEDPPA